MAERLRALVIDDSKDAATLILHELRHGGYDVVLERTDTRAGMEEALRKGHWDVILCDHAMPHLCAPEALQIAKQICPDVPFVIVSEWITDELANAVRKDGARDIVRKNKLAKLVPVLQTEMKKSKTGKNRPKEGKRKPA